MISPKEALEKLIAGNKRFAENKSIHPNRFEETREVLLNQQKPFVAVLSCSDSRVPIEIIFDAGLGDIFSVRTAGHVLSKEVKGSLEYAVKNLGVRLVVILGHENCGAINAAVQNYKNKGYEELSDNLKSIVNHIYPAIESTEKFCNKDDDEFLSAAIKSNILYQLEDLLKRDAYIADKAKSGEIAVVAARYNLATGLVEIFE